MEIDIKKICKKWQKEWEKARVYESNPKKDVEKKFITAAFPYPNSPQHIGHGRTYTVADVYARYLRMKGYNVLFPMGFHVTGTPIVSMAKKIRERDEELLNIFEKIYGISREKALSLSEPQDLVLYFSKEIEEGMKEMGFSIDWRRKFYTFDKKFNKFIEWQFKKLKKLNLLTQGKHPVAWCPADKNAVSAHDTKGDVDPEIEEITAIKFKYDDGFLVVSTYRPETLFGVTNIWVNPNVKYVKCKFNDEIIYISEKAAEILKHQINIEILEKLNGNDLIGKEVVTPLGNRVKVFPATFVKEDEGSGIVMSVPAHAPYDYLALRDLGKIEEVGLPVIIEIKGYNIPAKEIVEKMNVKDQRDPKAKDATYEVYKKEAHEGKMKINNKEYNNLPVSEARKKIREELFNSKNGFPIFVIANGPVYCRCGERVVVKIVENQWFIDYKNKEWKEKTKSYINEMKIIPEKTKIDYIYTVDWLKQKACTRSQGLGSKFPFDKSQIVESLSDSTIYMAYYTISHLLNEIDENEINDDFFDYVFLGEGNGNPKWKKLRDEFLYWYPVDSRHSGADLIKNHLTFYIFNHIAIFPKNLWPKQIVTNGFVLMEGKKMSKSLGNILPLRKAIEEYGADVVRISILAGAELSADTDFSRAVAQGIENRLRFIFSLLEYGKESAKDEIDFWLLSRLHKRIENLDRWYENFELREIIKEFIYEMVVDLNWYLKRATKPKLKEFFEDFSKAIAPLAPHFAEEIWSSIGNKGFIVNERFVNLKKELINEKIERKENLIREIVEDIKNIENVAKIKAKKATIIIAANWKRKAYLIAKEEKNLERAIKKCFEIREIKERSDEAIKFLKQIGKNIHSLQEILEQEEEIKTIENAKSFISKELNLEELIFVKEEEAKHPKASQAIPLKPAIVLE